MTSVIPLKHLARINERALPATTDPDREIRYVDIGSVGRGKLVHPPQRMRFGVAPSRARRLVSDGDTIVSTVRTYLRAVWPINGDTDGLVVSTGFAVLTPTDVDPRYFSWWVLSDVFIEEVVARSVGVSYPAINASELGNLGVRVPPLTEQRVIADYLDTETSRIDTLITKKRRMIELLQERRTAMIDEYVGSFDTPLIAIRHLSSHITSGPRGWAQYTSASGTVFVRITNIDRNEIHLDMSDTLFVNAPQTAESLRTEVRGGDVLVSITADIGSVGIVPETLSGAHISQHVALVRPNQETRTRWLAYAIKATPSQIQLDSGQYGGTKTQLSLGDIAGLRVPCPHLRVQDHILRKLEPTIEATRTAIKALHHQIALLTERRQALITATVTGEFAVPVDRS